MLDRDRPPTHRSEEPEHETVIWDRLRAEAESSRGSSVYPAAKLGDPSESVYLEYDDEELLEAMHADDDDNGGSAGKGPPPPPPHRPTTLGLGTPSFVEADGHDEPVEEDLSEDMSMLAHLTLPPHVLAKGVPVDDEHDGMMDDIQASTSDADSDHADKAAPAVRSSEPPPLVLQTRASQPPMLPSRGSQPPQLPTRSSQPGIMDRTFQPPNERERGSQPPGFSFQASVPPSYPTPGSGDRTSRPPSQPPLPPSFVTAETVEDPFPKKPAEPTIFERTQDLFDKPGQPAATPGARWEQAWAEWDRQFDIPSLPVEQGTASRSRLLVPGIVGLVALVGLSAAGFRLMGAAEPSAEAPKAQAPAQPSAAEQTERDQAAVRAANEALAQMAAAEAAAKKRTAEKLAAANAGSDGDSDSGGQQVVAAVTTESAPMSKAEERERYREERRAARREARHRRRELKRQQEREAARASAAEQPSGTSKKVAKGEDSLYGVGDEDEE
jgi:hypothetical protein